MKHLLFSFLFITSTLFGAFPGEFPSNVTVTEIETGRFGDGSLAAPSMSFTLDPDSGIYRIGTNNVGIVTNGILGLQVNSNQDVFIPAGNLSIAGGIVTITALSSDNTVALLKTNANDTGVVRMSFEDGDGANAAAYAYNSANDTFSFSMKQDGSSNSVLTFDRANTYVSWNDAYSHRNLSYERTTLALTLASEAIDVSNQNYIRMTSDDATAANRIFTLTGAVDGQILHLLWNDTDEGQLVDTGNVRLAGNWEPTNIGESILLISQGGGDWTELSRSDPT